MAREDLYAGGLAAGAGAAGAGALAASTGNRMRQQGRAQARANSGSRGQTVRGGRLVRAGGQLIYEANKGLGQFRRVKGSNGKTVYMKPAGGFAPTKAFQDDIKQGKTIRTTGAGQIATAKTRRVKAIQGIGQMRRGRLVARGGIGAAALGGLVALGSVAAGERYRTKRTRSMDTALLPPPAKVERPASEYRAMTSDGIPVRVQEPLRYRPSFLKDGAFVEETRKKPKGDAAAQWLSNAERIRRMDGFE